MTTSYLQSVKNALRILRAFTLEQPKRSIRELSNELNISKSSVQRSLATLASEGFVKKDPITRQYELGVSVLELSTIVLNDLDLHTEARPIVKRLVQEVNETAHIAVLENYQTVYLSKTESNEAPSIITHSGRQNPAYCTSSGKLLLAYSDSDTVEKVLSEELIPYTEHTITDKTELREHLSEIYRKGYSISNEELRTGITAISAPIRNHNNQVIAAVNIVGPIHRIQPKQDYYLKAVLRAAKEISKSLGYWG